MRLATLKLAIRNLLLHKLRSFLTMLGTILGVGSVIAMLAIGEGSKREAVERIRELGATNIIIKSIKPQQEDGEVVDSNSGSSQQGSNDRVIEYGLKHKDFDQLTQLLPQLKKAVPISLIRREVRKGSRRLLNARILGTTPDYFDIKNLEVSRGRLIADTDLSTMANVTVLGAGAAEKLFSFRDPIGEEILIGEAAYKVVGILKEQDPGGAKAGSLNSDNFNQDIYISLEAARARFGELQMIVRAGSREYERTQLSEITLSVFSEDQVSITADLARKILKPLHPGARDYEIQVPLELLKQAEREKRVWNIVLGSIAGISLLVGGIGIMNIMLATITERTREIGIRRALGARQRDITLQFLVETMVLSTTGGIFGLIVGVGIPFGVTLWFELQTAISMWSVVLAFFISVGIGIVFGIYPARRAALMDPIEALRHE